MRRREKRDGWVGSVHFLRDIHFCLALVERRGNCGWDNTNTTSDKCIGVEAEVPDKVVYLVPDPMLP